ncbi:Tryptophan 2,3-dioxygenase apoenzyme [Chitinophaga costaii]|uniref:Tryptophan 2,3-dioxygenase apoenzyme n=1 Tax=Chitinophaga costaii TaxID=1335309 RepID=A0A1C4FPX0_9BACT|nr:tryptophan 2,3-dioxygenase family protein [Chitinophaga costaii]PUZ20449.1 tryptophan 2,3-dioxygenase [Chitinophaga costaii]SCC58019.1 Tryptophan 2,3-dioxygenase apoenzyme [Chitinophaga costaii]
MVTTEIAEKIRQLEEKYAAMGQSLSAYLDGLLYADYLTYWDYIQLDVLLNLQHPRTPIPDENIFIIYHQITELYFKLTLQAIGQICEGEPDVQVFTVQLKRINNYFKSLISSFEIMVEGMDKEQFLKFRMALLPASGFQSGQFRMIEICSTNLRNLVYVTQREELRSHTDLQHILNHIYWRSGATELASGKRTLTLKQFEVKYMQQFLELAIKHEHTNLHTRYRQLPPAEQEALTPLLKAYDFNINVRWPLMHYKSAVRYLHKKPEDIAATGGTNWQQFLPPKHKRITFFPELWTEEELIRWGTAQDM